MSHPDRTAIYTTRHRILQLRQLAAECGLVQTRGIGTGEIGSLSQLLDVLADGYAARPEAVRDFIQDLTDARQGHLATIAP
jgi:hypothetical protein